jgi:hypothetical protein
MVYRRWSTRPPRAGSSSAPMPREPCWATEAAAPAPPPAAVGRSRWIWVAGCTAPTTRSRWRAACCWSATPPTCAASTRGASSGCCSTTRRPVERACCCGHSDCCVSVAGASRVIEHMIRRPVSYHITGTSWRRCMPCMGARLTAPLRAAGALPGRHSSSCRCSCALRAPWSTSAIAPTVARPAFSRRTRAATTTRSASMPRRGCWQRSHGQCQCAVRSAMVLCDDFNDATGAGGSTCLSVCQPRTECTTNKLRRKSISPLVSIVPALSIGRSCLSAAAASLSPPAPWAKPARVGGREPAAGLRRHRHHLVQTAQPASQPASQVPRPAKSVSPPPRSTPF